MLVLLSAAHAAFRISRRASSPPTQVHIVAGSRQIWQGTVSRSRSELFPCVSCSLRLRVLERVSVEDLDRLEETDPMLDGGRAYDMAPFGG